MTTSASTTPSCAAPSRCLRRLCCQRLRERRARADAELGVAASEVFLHGLAADEQGLGNLAVAEALSRQPGDPEFACRQRGRACEPHPPGLCSGGTKLDLRPHDEKLSAALSSQLAALLQRSAGIHRALRAA